MARQRSNYQVDALYVGPNIATGIHYTTGIYGSIASQNITAGRVVELYRVQSANYSFNIAREDVNQFGELAAIDRIILNAPTVSLDFSYLLANFSNEAALGFTVSSGTLVSAISGMLTKVSDEHNIFVRTVSEGNDVKDYLPSGASANAVIGLGNAFISSYTSEGSVGNFPTVNCSFECLNMKADFGSSGNYIPAVFPSDGTSITGWFYELPVGKQSEDSSADLSTSVLRPGDITVSLGAYDGLGAMISDAKIQSYSISFDLARESLQKLGSKYAYSKEVQFPVTVSLSVTALVGDIQSGNLVDVINSNTKYDCSVTINKPATSVPMLRYTLKQLTLDSQEITSSIGPNKTVTLNLTTQLGGPQDTAKGLFLSGSN
jgi:hypothetical protein